jgi:hypothetical protein
MASCRITQAALRFIDGARQRELPPEKISERHRIDKEGRARNLLLYAASGIHHGGAELSIASRHGEIDLIGWEGQGF